jgi:hypothetical protein
MAQTVQQVKPVSGSKEELDFSVLVIVYVLYPAAEGLLERNAPDTLSVFVVETDGQAGVLVQLVSRSITWTLLLLSVWVLS